MIKLLTLFKVSFFSQLRPTARLSNLNRKDTSFFLPYIFPSSFSILLSFEFFMVRERQNERRKKDQERSKFTVLP